MTVRGRAARGPLGRGALMVGVVGLVAAAVMMGGGQEGGAHRAIGAPLHGLPVFPRGTMPVDAPAAGDDPRAFARWATRRAVTDWRAAFARARRPWADPGPLRGESLPWVGDPRPALVLGVGLTVADHVARLTGVAGRLERARGDHPADAGALAVAGRRMRACLAGAWGGTVMPAPVLARAAPRGLADAVRRGAESGDPAVCDVFGGRTS